MAVEDRAPYDNQPTSRTGAFWTTLNDIKQDTPNNWRSDEAFYGNGGDGDG